MKKAISLILVLSMLLGSALVPSLVYAEEDDKSSEVVPIELNTAYEAEFEKTDYDKKTKTYSDMFEFKVPAVGKITLTVKSDAPGYTSKYASYWIFDSKSDKFWGPDSSKFKGKWSTTLKKGTYYFAAVYTKTKDKAGEMLGTPYTFKFTYKPDMKAPTLTKVKAKTKGFKARWKKFSAVSGYQLEYSVKKNFSKSEKVKIEGAKTLETVVKELKAEKKYYVRLRTYRTFKFGAKKKTYYSKWSEVKTVKTK